jgi:1-acyl-sn-glycerol-3-phosphate acyltransferase
MTGQAIASLCRLVCGISVEWHCDPQGPVRRIYFGNHSSHLDFIAIWSALPPQLRQSVRPVAARDYWHQNAIRRHVATDVFNAVLVERRRPGTSRAEAARATTAFIVAEMRNRYSLILFPEGTRSPGGSVGPFKSGLYFLSQARPEIELIPVYLENLHRILPKGEALPVPRLSRVVFGPPLQMAVNQDKAQFLEQARAAVIALGAHHDAEC